MRIFHFNTDCMKAMFVDEGNNFWRFIICHQKVGLTSSQDVKQISVVNCAVGIQTGASLFPPDCGVWRVDESHGFLSPPLQEGF